MSCYSKEKPERNDYNNICKNHSARSDRAELYRICPSKLSKRELEDLYFSLLENNLDLKRTINGQEDKIRGLSTKVQRMTAAQKVLQAKEMKECCIGTKSVVSEQKESLSELKRANQRMVERIRMLNMRLCSAKQFYKKAPQMSTSRCIRCATAPTPKKHSCLDKQSEPVLKLSTSCQFIDRDAVSMKSAQTETRDLEKQNEELPCDENKCRSLMEELKLKIVNLQEELSHVHEEYSSRIGRLEAEVADVRRENVRVSGERRASHHELQHAAKRNSDLLADLRTSEGRCAELSTQLSVEKRKVAEFETRLKAASISDRVNKTIEDHSKTKLNETTAPPQDTNYAQPQNGKLADIPECICSCPTRVANEKAATKGSKSATCACPPPLEGEQIVTATSKSPFTKFSSSKSKSSKTTPSKAIPTTNSKNVHCGCPVMKESELMKNSPIKDKKCVSCACPVWKDSEFVQSTPTKAELNESASTKDTKCENCNCIIRTDGGLFESSTLKTGIHSSPKVADTRESPRAYHEDGKMSKASDDSGYMDTTRSQDTPDEATLNKLNKELIKKVLELQSQVDSMKITGVSELPGAKQYKLSGNDRTSFSGVTPSTAKSAAEKSGTLSENLKRTDAAESSQPDMSISKSWTSDVEPDKLFFDMSENRETNKLGVHPTIKLDTVEDTAIKAIEGVTGKLKAATEERRLSKSNGQTMSNGQKITNGQTTSNFQKTLNVQNTSNGRTNIYSGLDDSKLVPDKLEMPTAEERGPELELDRLTELVPDRLNISIADQRAPESDFGNEQFAINNYEEQNKAELVPTKLKVPDIIDNRRVSDAGATTPKLAINGDLVPNKTESFSDHPQVQVTEERKLSQNDERVLTISAGLPGNMKPAMTEEVPAKKTLGKPKEERRLSHQDPTTSKEDCEYCPTCTYDTECASQSKPKIVQGMKNDRHNSLQIPGPIPTTNTNNNNNKEWKKNMFRHFTEKRRDSKTKDKLAKQKKQPTKENKEKESENLREKLKESYETTSGPIHLDDVPVLDIDKNTQTTEQPEVMDNDLQKKYYNESKDSIQMHHKRLSKQIGDPVMKDTVGHVHDVSMNNFYTRSDNVIPSMSMQYNNQEHGTQIEDNIDEKPQGQEKQMGLTNNNAEPRGRKRDVSVYRRHSGTLCFRTLPAPAPSDDQPRACRCQQQVDGRCVGKLKDRGTQAQVVEEKTPNHQRRRSSTSEQGTYTVGAKENRSTSPDNTDFEMSYMSDLPYEKDEKKPVKSRPLSPGEDKMTSTYTDSYCSPATNYSLSEGEVPTTSARKISYDNDKEKIIPTKPAQEIVPTQSMEAALQAISDELARCKTLLTSQRPAESPFRETNQSQTSTPDNSSPIALRRGVATQSIGDTYTPKCIFTLHIGTVVLSDEAVLSSLNKSLLLMWKFYDQNVAMTRMRAGRVVLFDFSTEYDIKITDDFLSYMKHEELLIVICELDKENEPFATCSLPLRDALLHTNRRADMSLALVAGPQMISARAANGAAADALDGSDEMGVMDLWCMLRADANMVPGINLAISQPPTSTPANKRHHSRVMQQILDDDHSNECADLDLTLEKRNARPVSVGERTGKNVCQDVEFTRTSHRWSKPLMRSTTPTTSTKVEEAYDASKYPPGRIRSSSMTCAGADPLAPLAPLAPPAPSAPAHPLRRNSTNEPEHDGSGIIINEVNAKIKTPSDMKHALERSSFQSEFTRMPKPDEEITSQAHSSLGSSRSFFARLQRRGSPRTEQRRDSNQQNAMLQSERRVSKNTLDTPIRFKDRDETSDMEIYRKYENISKLIGSNRAESKKCVTIVPKYVEPVLDEPQRLTASQDADNAQSFEEGQERNSQSLDITILWLALNEECEAMVDPHVQRVYVAYTFLGRSGAELETPVSLPKPKHYVDKCYFNFKKTFELEDSELPMLGHMARCRTGSKVSENEKDCIIFSVVSEPPEDPLGLENCEDIGYAYLYLGDLLAYSAGSSSYTEVIPVRGAGSAASVCGVLAVRLDGLDVVRRCLLLSSSLRDLADWSVL